jgi:membrane carboxypeptidase/penicillin-binding protein
MVPAGLTVAGKTGTTDEMRDSWFAGFSGNHLAVVWLGRDDNQPIDLSGAAGAMPIWGDIIREIGSQSLQLAEPPDIEFVPIDPATGLRADIGCQRTEALPFILGSAPHEIAPCGDTWASVETRESIDSTGRYVETVPVQPSADWQGEVRVDEPADNRIESAVRKTVDWLREMVR